MMRRIIVWVVLIVTLISMMACDDQDSRFPNCVDDKGRQVRCPETWE